MARITASGVPEKHPELGEVMIRIEGDEFEIKSATFERKSAGALMVDQKVEKTFMEDMSDGPSYPLCADPDTMRCALFVLYEWFGEEESCWTEEPKHVILEGEIDPMESVPGRVY